VSNREQPVCEICGQPTADAGDGETLVVSMASQGQEFVRHRRCQLPELLDRA